MRVTDAGGGAGTWQVELHAAVRDRRRRRSTCRRRSIVPPGGEADLVAVVRADAGARPARTTASSSSASGDVTRRVPYDFFVARPQLATRCSRGRSRSSSPATRAPARTAYSTYRCPTAPFGPAPDYFGPPMAESRARRSSTSRAERARRERRRRGRGGDARDRTSIPCFSARPTRTRSRATPARRSTSTPSRPTRTPTSARPERRSRSRRRSTSPSTRASDPFTRPPLAGRYVLRSWVNDVTPPSPAAHDARRRRPPDHRRARARRAVRASIRCRSRSATAASSSARRATTRSRVSPSSRCRARRGRCPQEHAGGPVSASDFQEAKNVNTVGDEIMPNTPFTPVKITGVVGPSLTWLSRRRTQCVSTTARARRRRELDAARPCRPLPRGRPHRRRRPRRRRRCLRRRRGERGARRPGSTSLHGVAVGRGGHARPHAARAVARSAGTSPSSPAPPAGSARRSRAASPPRLAAASCSRAARTACARSPRSSAASSRSATSPTATPSTRRRSRARAAPADPPAREQRRHPRPRRLPRRRARRLEQVLRTNYLGSVWCLRAFLPGARGGGAGRRRQHRLRRRDASRSRRRARTPPSKHAQLAFSRATAVELARSRHPRAHGQPGLRRDGGLPAGDGAAQPGPPPARDRAGVRRAARHRSDRPRPARDRSSRGGTAPFALAQALVAGPARPRPTGRSALPLAPAFAAGTSRSRRCTPQGHPARAPARSRCLALAAGEVEVVVELAAVRAGRSRLSTSPFASNSCRRSTSGSEPRVRRVARALEAVELERLQRVDRCDLVDDEARGPPSRVTRTISAMTISGCGMWWSVRSVPARSNEKSSNGSAVASPSTNVTLGSSAGALTGEREQLRARGRRRRPRGRAARARARASPAPVPDVERTLVAVAASTNALHAVAHSSLPHRARPDGGRAEAGSAVLASNRSGVDDDTAGSGGFTVDAADQLVVDGTGDSRMVLGENASPEQDDGSSERAARDRAGRRSRPSRPSRRRGSSSPATRTSVPVRSRRKPSA